MVLHSDLTFFKVMNVAIYANFSSLEIQAMILTLEIVLIRGLIIKMISSFTCVKTSKIQGILRVVTMDQ